MTPSEAGKKFNSLQPFFKLLQDSRKLKNSDEYKVYFKLYDIRNMFFTVDKNYIQLKKQLDQNKEKFIVSKKGTARWTHQRETSRLIFNYVLSSIAYIEKYLANRLDRRHEKFAYKCLTQELRNYLAHKGELPLRSQYRIHKGQEKIHDEKIMLQEVRELLVNHGREEYRTRSKNNFEEIDNMFNNEIYVTGFFNDLHEILKFEHRKKLIELVHRDKEPLKIFENQVSKLLDRFMSILSENIITNNYFQYPITESQLRGLKWLLKQTEN